MAVFALVLPQNGPESCLTGHKRFVKMQVLSQKLVWRSLFVISAPRLIGGKFAGPYYGYPLLKSIRRNGVFPGRAYTPAVGRRFGKTFWVLPPAYTWYTVPVFIIKE